MVLDEQITTAQLTLQTLSLQRQLKQVRHQRREANEQHRQVAQHCEARMAQAEARCRLIIHGMRSLSDYVSVVGALYPSNPGGYVLRKHAQLLMCIRSQHILEKYNHLTENQYETMIGGLEETVEDLWIDVQELRDQREEDAYLLQEIMVVSVISRIKSYYQEKKNCKRSNGKNPCPTPLIQRLVSRKANERLLKTCIWQASWEINDSRYPFVLQSNCMYWHRAL